MGRPAVRNVLLILLAILAGSCKEDGTIGVPLPPVLSLTTPTLALSLRGASDSLSQNVTLLSDSEPVSWTASSQTPWVHLNLLTGTTPSTVSVTARSAGLAPGTHTGVVTFAAPGAVNSPIHLVVNATVEAQPILDVRTDTLTFAGTAGQAEAGQRTLAIANGGTGTLTWTASSASTWIRVTPSSGTGAATLTIAAGATDLTAGTWHGTVLVTAVGALSSPTAVPVKLVLAPRMFAVTAVANPGNGGSVTGAGSYQQGATARLDAVPANGFDFTNWTENGAVVSTAPSYSFAVTGDRSLTANFAPRVVTVSIATASQPVAGGTTTGAGTYPAGTTVSLQATPNPGNTFVNWTESGAEVSTSPNYSFVATLSRNLVANFLNSPTPTIYTVLASAMPTEGGTVSGAGTYVHGTSATLTATPNPTYRFVNWTENGTVVATTPIYTHIVTRDRSLVANFADSLQTIYTVLALAMPTEGGTVSGAGTYVHGTSATLTATPNPTYSFVNWTENGVGVSTTPTYTHVVTGNRTLVANFQAGPPPPIFTIFASAKPADGGTLSGVGTYVSGTNATLTATPTPPNTSVSWTENGVVVSTEPSYTFVVTRERTLVANFKARLTVTATASPTEGGTITGAGTFEVEVGTNVSLTATPTTGWTFKEWRDATGKAVANQPTYSFQLRKDETLVAIFLPPGFIEIGIIYPLENAPQGDSLFINVAVTSSHAITSVTATVEGRTVSLNPFPQRWMGNLNLAGLPSGQKTVVISATNSLGNTVTASTTFWLDRLPGITVSAPVAGSVARPTFNYSATCTDDDPAGCVSFTLYVQPDYQTQVLLASGTNSLNGVADLSAYNGQRVIIRFRAVDSRGQVSRWELEIPVESSTRLTLIGSVPGSIADYSRGRGLYRPDAGPARAALRTFPAGTDELITLPANKGLGTGFVTPLGMIGAINTPGMFDLNVFELRSGASSVGPGGIDLDVNGDYALYGVAGSSGSNTILYVRNLLTGTDTEITQNAGNIHNSVGPDGSAAFWSGTEYDIFWYVNGAVRRLTNDANTAVWNVYPLTDGINVVYMKQSPCCNIDQPTAIAMHDGTTETVLAPTSPGGLLPRQDYDINNGWIAFVRPDAGNVRQVWTRSPSGVLTQVSSFFGRSTIDALGSDGTVVFRSGERRYLATPGGPPQDISSALGDVIWRDGEFILLLDKTIWKIQ